MARCASSKASGIIVSATIARIAPAASAVTAAITAGENAPSHSPPSEPKFFCGEK